MNTLMNLLNSKVIIFELGVVTGIILCIIIIAFIDKQE